MNGIFFYMPRGFVVFPVRDLPREVRHEEHRMEHKANGIIEHFRRGEGLMSALVGQNPNACAEEPIDEAVHVP